MFTIPDSQVQTRLTSENPWWTDTDALPYREMRPRAYLPLLLSLVAESTVRRAVLVMGPRRVGKTVLLHHVVQRLLVDGVDPRSIVFCSVDHPLYNGRALEELLTLAEGASRTAPKYVFFDEIQYLSRWEVHLKSLVDHRPALKVTVSGSAAAALRLRSQESGAGRFTDFLLPPLTFHEYLDLTGTDSGVASSPESGWSAISDLSKLNDAFVEYINYGGYPEVALSAEIRANPQRFVKHDIIDKVLLRDLPSLYGIEDIQELNYLFTTLAYNTAQEVSLETLSKDRGIAKNTVRRYLEYLEAAFLIRRVYRVDRSAKRFKRETHFKVYLTNPSMRAALFGPVDADDDAMGALVETAVFAQWFHAATGLHYARWKDGEVDMVSVEGAVSPYWVTEIKWSDRPLTDSRGCLRAVVEFARTNGLKEATATSRSGSGSRMIDDVTVHVIPSAVLCFDVGRNLVGGKVERMLRGAAKTGA